MKSRKNTLLILVAVFFGTAFLYSWNLSNPKFGGTLPKDIMSQIEIAPVEEAITLAYTENGETLLVVRADQKGVEAVDLSKHSEQIYVDAVDAFADIGREKLRSIASSATTTAVYRWDDLAVPVMVGKNIVAAGTNFALHASEVNHDGEPFIFPKLSTATPWNASVLAGGRLDHEVEICAIPLLDFHAGEKTELAFLLCGDYTDRWLLVRDIDLGGEMGKTGFALGKGGETHLPVGALLVIPEAADFYKSFDMKLYVNAALRQHSSAALMIWDPWELLDRSLKECNSIYKKLDQELRLLDDCEKIPAKTLVLTGTPEGTMFHIATLWNPMFYLRSGDVVTASATYLGVTKNIIQ